MPNFNKVRETQREKKGEKKKKKKEEEGVWREKSSHLLV